MFCKLSKQPLDLPQFLFKAFGQKDAIWHIVWLLKHSVGRSLDIYYTFTCEKLCTCHVLEGHSFRFHTRMMIVLSFNHVAILGNYDSLEINVISY